MIIIRNSFIAKPGHASKLAAQIKEAAATMNLPNHRVMTDLTGDFNRVVLEFAVANLSEWETSMKNYATNQEFRAKMAGYTDLWLTGTRELFQVVE
jgi:hypothetical protein